MTDSLENIITDTEVTRMTEKRRKYKGVLYTTDHHYPYMNQGMKKVEKQILRDEQPWMHVMGGDWIDGSGLSSFDPNPQYINQTQDEIDGFVEYLAELHEASPDTKRIMIYGNHDEGRKERAAKEANPFGLASLRVLKFKHIFEHTAEEKGLDIGELEFHMEYELGPRNRGVMFFHGDKRLGGEYQRHMSNGTKTGTRRNVVEVPYNGVGIVYGHGHRQQVGVHHARDTQAHMVGWMGDDSKLAYTPHSRYENGLMWIDYSPNSRPDPIFHMNNIKVQPNGEFVLNGKIYQAR